jgi:hypothetical protein
MLKSAKVYRVRAKKNARIGTMTVRHKDILADIKTLLEITDTLPIYFILDVQFAGSHLLGSPFSVKSMPAQAPRIISSLFTDTVSGISIQFDVPPLHSLHWPFRLSCVSAIEHVHGKKIGHLSAMLESSAPEPNQTPSCHSTLMA